MSRKVILISVLLLLVGGIVFMLPEGKFLMGGGSYRPLFEIMENAGAHVTGGELYYWASLPQKDCLAEFSRQELENLADGLIVKLGGEGSSPAEKMPTVVQREGRLPGGARIKLFLQPLEGEKGETVHLILNINGEEPRSLAELAVRVPALLDGRVIGSTISFCLIGEIAEEMQAGEMEELAHLLVEEIGGARGQGVRDGQMVSVTGYYPRLGNYFQAGSERLNINIALRAGDLPGRTRIWAGTPLISSWY